jgi:hypothetical protein
MTPNGRMKNRRKSSAAGAMAQAMGETVRFALS